MPATCRSAEAARTVLTGSYCSHGWWLLMPYKQGLQKAGNKKNLTKPDTQIHQHWSLATLLAINRHSRANCSLNQKTVKEIPFKWMFPSPPQPPWSLFLPFPPLFKSTSLTSLQYHLSHTSFDLAEIPSHSPCTFPRQFPRNSHFISPHPPLVVSFSPSMVFLALLSFPGGSLGTTSNEQKKCKGGKLLQKYCPDHWCELYGNASHNSCK